MSSFIFYPTINLLCESGSANPDPGRRTVPSLTAHHLEDGLRIAQLNANSFPGHLHLGKARLSNHFYHVNSISETWLHTQVSDDLIRLDDYFLVRNDREGKRGGGVACYIHKSLQVRILAASLSLFSNAPEYLIFELKAANSETVLFPPRNSVQNRLEKSLCGYDRFLSRKF